MVGIENTNRYRDLLPQKSDGSPTGIDNFIGFFIEELIPFIENNYRIKDYRIIMGPQVGANFVIYTMFEKYPYSANGCWRLGNISQRSGNLQQAREYYRKVLEVHPNDVDIVRSRLSMIERKINESVAYAIEQV